MERERERWNPAGVGYPSRPIRSPVKAYRRYVDFPGHPVETVVAVLSGILCSRRADRGAECRGLPERETTREAAFLPLGQ